MRQAAFCGFGRIEISGDGFGKRFGGRPFAGYLNIKQLYSVFTRFVISVFTGTAKRVYFELNFL
jgi:hypothetical protein